jgi:hypothetical protein
VSLIILNAHRKGRSQIFCLPSYTSGHDLRKANIPDAIRAALPTSCATATNGGPRLVYKVPAHFCRSRGGVQMLVPWFQSTIRHRLRPFRRDCHIGTIPITRLSPSMTSTLAHSVPEWLLKCCSQALPTTVRLHCGVAMLPQECAPHYPVTCALA